MKSQTQRSLLLGFVGSIVSCGLVGVYCLVTGRMGSFEARVLGTTALVGAASILGLACAIPWERRRWHPIGPVGMASVAVALALSLIAIWADFAPWDMEAFFKAVAVASVAAITLPHIGLLSLARLRREYLWTRTATIVLIVLLAAQFDLTFIAEIEDDLWFRAMGILGIGVVCGTIAVPVLHRVSAIRTREDVRTVELLLSITCPRCDRAQQLPVGRSKCGGCGLKFSIEIEEENCRTCGYPLYRLESSNCPECGTPIAQQPVR